MEKRSGEKLILGILLPDVIVLVVDHVLKFGQEGHCGIQISVKYSGNLACLSKAGGF